MGHFELLCCSEIPFSITSPCTWWLLLCRGVLTYRTWVPFVFGLPGKASSWGELSALPAWDIRLQQGVAALALSSLLFSPGVAEVLVRMIPRVACSRLWIMLSPRRRGLFCHSSYLNAPPLQWEQGSFVRCCESSFRESVNKQTFLYNV